MKPFHKCFLMELSSLLCLCTACELGLGDGLISPPSSGDPISEQKDSGSTATSDASSQVGGASGAANEGGIPQDSQASPTNNELDPENRPNAPEGTPVQRHGQLKVVGAELRDQGGQMVQLKGMSLFWHNWMGQYFSAGTVDWLADDWGASVVRAAMGVEPEDAYLSNPEDGKAHVIAVVDAAITKGVYVIIDWHAHDIHREEARTFFTDMAQRYGKYPNVIYELYNEPDEESWAEVKRYSEEVITAIRAIDNDNLIIVGTPHWDQDVQLAADDPISSQSNLAYSLHFYTGSHGEFLRDRARYAKQKGICLFATEWGTSDADGGSDGKTYLNEADTWLAFLKEQGISWCNWSIADKEESSAALKPGASGEGGWSINQLTTSGQYVREKIKN